MFSTLSLFLSQRFYREKKRLGFMSFMSGSVVVGLALGVAALIIGLSIMNGFERELKKRILDVIPHIEMSSPDMSERTWLSLAQELKAKPHITQVQQQRYIDVLAENGAHAKVMRLQAVDSLAWLSQYKTAGYFEDLDASSVILTEAIAQRLDVGLGDVISVVHVAANQRPSYIYLTVKALIAFHSQLDSVVGFIGPQAASSLDLPLHGLALSVDNVFAASVVANQLRSEYFTLDTIKTWIQDYGHLYQDIQLVRTLMVAIMLIVMAVACFNLLTSLILLINEKRAEIAILKTMGCNRMQLMLVFCYLGAASGVFGATLGVFLGVVGAMALPDLVHIIEQASGQTLLDASIYFINFVPVDIYTRDVIGVFCAAVLFSLLAALYPAWQAVALKPAKELANQG